MELKKAIDTRRSVRNYADKAVTREVIEILLDSAVQAPSAMNSQPWAFSIIQDEDLLKEISIKSKKLLLEKISTNPHLERYRQALEDENFNIFYNAKNLVTIYAKPEGPCPNIDCSLAAQNIMLTAHSLGLGSCWIGFAQAYLDSEEFKTKMGVPPHYTVVAPLIIGYPAVANIVIEKKEAEVIFWEK